MKLPNGHNATVDEGKVRDYLLSQSHPIGRFKARVFASVGFVPGNWQLFARALTDLAATGEATLDAVPRNWALERADGGRTRSGFGVDRAPRG